MSHESEQRSIQHNRSDQIDQQELETRVILLVEALANELNPGRHVQASLHSSLQRDLGFDSLGLSELLARTEKALPITIEPILMATDFSMITIQPS